MHTIRATKIINVALVVNHFLVKTMPSSKFTYYNNNILKVIYLSAKFNQWFFIWTSIRTKFKHLVHGHISNPYIIFGINCNHMGQEKEITSPRTNNMPGGIDSYHCIFWNWFISVLGVLISHVKSIHVPVMIATIKENHVTKNVICDATNISWKNQSNKCKYIKYTPP